MSLREILKLLAEMSEEDRDLLLKQVESIENPKQEETTSEPKEVVKRAPRGSKKGSDVNVTGTVNGAKKKPFINKFEKSEIFNSCKEDIERDKKMWQGREPSPRVRKVKTIKVNCMSCQKECEVDPSLVYYMSKSEYSFTCDKCQRRKRK